MIQNRYVSFKTAKLLREKGFNEPIHTICSLVYKNDPVTRSVSYSDRKENWNGKGWFNGTTYSCPTQEIAIEWLRVKHNIHVFAYPEYKDDELMWGWKIVRLTNPLETWSLLDFKTCEDACEEGILCALTNLVE